MHVVGAKTRERVLPRLTRQKQTEGRISLP
jgi:hypothetical protein